MTLPVGPHAIAGDHQHGGALYRNRVPDVNAITMQGDRDLAHSCPSFTQALCGLAYRGVNVGLGVRPTETLIHNPDT